MDITIHLSPPALVLILSLVALFSLMLTVTVAFFTYPLKNNEQIYVSVAPMESPKQIVEGFFEYFVFLKVSRLGYRNYPSGNIRIIPTFWTAAFASVTIYSIMFCLNKMDPQFVIGKKDSAEAETFFLLSSSFLAIWMGLYWKEKKDLHEKWLYLAELYNQVISSPPGKNRSEFSCRESLRVALVLDLLTMGMWGHKSFSAIFEGVLVEAYSLKYGISQMEAFTHLRGKSISFSEAEICILEYQEAVIFKDKILYQPTG